MSGFTSKLETIFAQAEPKPQSLRNRMEMIHSHPDVMAAMEKFLDGKTVMGHDIGDRCAFGAVCLDVARKTAPLKADPWTASRVMRRVLKDKGVPLLRSGKIDGLKLEAQTPATEQS